MELSSIPHLIHSLIYIQCIVINVINLISFGQEELEIPFINIEMVRDVRTEPLSRSRQLRSA